MFNFFDIETIGKEVKVFCDKIDKRHISLENDIKSLHDKMDLIISKLEEKKDNS